MSFLDLGLVKAEMTPLRHGIQISLPCQRVLQKPLEDTPHIHLFGSGEDDDSVKIEKHTRIEQVSGVIIDQGLENGSVIETKRHDQIFLMTVRSVEGNFPLIPLSGLHNMICILALSLC